MNRVIIGAIVFILALLFVVQSCTASFLINGMNYFPSRYGWERMWCNFDEQGIEKDLNLARSIGVNTLRTFLQFSLIENLEFAPSKCPSTPASEILRRVDRFLSIADSKGIKVILGLFDEAEYLPFIVGHNTTIALQHIDRVLNYMCPSTGLPLANDPRVIMWDLVNEMDDPAKQFPDGEPLILRRDVKVNVNNGGIKWLRSIYKRVLRLTNTDHYITFGLMDLECAVHLIKNGFSERIMPQYHEYIAYNQEGYKEQIAKNTRYIKEQTGFDHVLIGETGAPSNLTDGDFVTWDAQKQKEYITAVLEASAKSECVVGVVVWSLTDLSSDLIASKDTDNYMGIFDSKGNAKPVVSTVRKYFTK